MVHKKRGKSPQKQSFQMSPSHMVQTHTESEEELGEQTFEAQDAADATLFDANLVTGQGTYELDALTNQELSQSVEAELEASIPGFSRQAPLTKAELDKVLSIRSLEESSAPYLLENPLQQSALRKEAEPFNPSQTEHNYADYVSTESQSIAKGEESKQRAESSIREGKGLRGSLISERICNIEKWKEQQVVNLLNMNKALEALSKDQRLIIDRMAQLTDQIESSSMGPNKVFSDLRTRFKGYLYELALRTYNMTGYIPDMNDPDDEVERRCQGMLEAHCLTPKTPIHEPGQMVCFAPSVVASPLKLSSLKAQPVSKDVKQTGPSLIVTARSEPSNRPSVVFSLREIITTHSRVKNIPLTVYCRLDDLEEAVTDLQRAEFTADIKAGTTVKAVQAAVDRLISKK